MKIVNGVLVEVNASDLDVNGVFHNEEVTEVKEGLFYDMDELTGVSLPNCTTCGNYCFSYNQALTTISLPALTTCGDYCFSYNHELTSVNLPALTTCGNDCFSYNQALTTISLPALTTCGDYCFSSNHELTSVNLPALTTCGNDCFISNQALTSVSLPALTTCGNDCFSSNKALTSVSLPALTTCGNCCFSYNQALTTISLPALTTCGYDGFRYNQALTSVNLPALTKCGNYCFRSNQALTKLRLNKYKLNVMDVDGYCYVIATQKTTKGVAVYTGYNLVRMVDGKIEKKESYVAEKEGFKAHGETLKQAINDLHFKVAAEKIKKEPIYPDTIVSIMHYRTITGACEFGCKDWLERNGLKDITEMKASELVPLLKKTGAWGSDKFMQLIQF